MKMKAKRAILLAVAVLGVSIITAGCQQTSAAQPTSAQKQNEQARATSVNNVMTATKTPVLEVSLDRENIAKRIERSNDGNHIQWIYLFSDTGAVIERFAVRGKVTSGNKRLNPAYALKHVNIDRGEWNGTDYKQIEMPDEMGTYGSSNPYIFWFDMDDTLVQSSLKYVVLDKPVNIKGGVMRVSDVDAKELAEKRRIEEHLRQGKSLEAAKKAAGVN